jgi:hypothetical protein
MNQQLLQYSGGLQIQYFVLTLWAKDTNMLSSQNIY